MRYAVWRSKGNIVSSPFSSFNHSKCLTQHGSQIISQIRSIRWKFIVRKLEGLGQLRRWWARFFGAAFTSNYKLQCPPSLSICRSKPDIISQLGNKISRPRGLLLFSDLIRALIPSSENKQRSNVDRGVKLLGDLGFFLLSLLLLEWFALSVDSPCILRMQ